MSHDLAPGCGNGSHQNRVATCGFRFTPQDHVLSSGDQYRQRIHQIVVKTGDDKVYFVNIYICGKDGRKYLVSFKKSMRRDRPC